MPASKSRIHGHLGVKPEDVKARQDKFLEIYESDEGGTIVHAAEQVGISRNTVRLWRTKDVQGFVRRFEVAHRTFAERGEKNWLYKRLKDPKCHPNLVMFALKALLPQKYRELAMNTDITGETIIDELKRVRKQLTESAKTEAEEKTATVEQQVEDILSNKGN